MKKITTIFLILVLTITLVACEENNVDENNYTIIPAEGSKVPYLDGGWVNVWHDEFDGETLDETKWTYELGTGNWGWGNGELQNYTRSNTDVSNGTLKIQARREVLGSSQYTSSRIITKNKGDFKYGRIQASIKLPSGRGIWPAFWMMPTHSVYGGWPRSGEIDIMEYVGYSPNKGHTTVHTEKRNGGNGQQIGTSYDLVNHHTEFQLFEIIWLPGIIESYVNGEKVAQFAYVPAFNQDGPHHHTFPFDQEFFLILNVAVGGEWGGLQGVDQDIFPTTMEVDFVRVYELDANYIDDGIPSTPSNIRAMSSYPNSLFWDHSHDDTAVEYYDVYINDEYYKHVSLSNVILEGFEKGEEVSVKIRAIDLVGNQSEFSEPFIYKVE